MSNLRARAAACGIEPGYHDSTGEWQAAPVETLRRLLEALEPGIESLPPLDEPWIPDAAERCHLPGNLRAWGWSLQLYALRSAASWGIGDLGDLAVFARRARREQGAGLVMVNPLGASTPGAHMQPSPYLPSSRVFRNPVYLGLDQLADTPAPEDPLRGAVGRLNASELIDRDAVWALKLPALAALFDNFEGSESFDRYRAEEGTPLADFATFSAIAEQHGADWRAWPADLQAPTAPGVEPFRRRHPDAVLFHSYLQWLIDEQLSLAAQEAGLINDLPVGIDPAGADAWVFRGAFAEGFNIGAPPDDFNRRGQNWGAAPFHPARLAAMHYEPFIRTIRAAFRHTAGLRIDHVMGLFRLFWIPHGCDPIEGTYVRYPARALLDLLAAESRRAQAFVVGEDLGTVQDGVREALAARDVLSYRLLIFEPSVESLPRNSMATVSTHDLPTVAGIWTGSDLDDQNRAEVLSAPQTLGEMRGRLAAASGLPHGAAVSEVVQSVYSSLAATDARIVTATPEDALGEPRRPNMPGTVDSWPNWCIPLPKTMEEFFDSPGVQQLAETLTGRGRDPGGSANGP
ncbi:MAG: 4-alpha-glucanotransferase [Actinomycetota bacterium]